MSRTKMGILRTMGLLPVMALLSAGLLAWPIASDAKQTLSSESQKQAEQPSSKPDQKFNRFERLKRGALAGDSQAQYGLAMFYGPPVNRISASEAYQLLDRSAKSGNLHALVERGYRQTLGKGTPADPENGLATLREAGTKEHPKALFILGALYSGQAKKAVAADQQKAVRFYEECSALLGRSAIDRSSENFYIRQCLTNLGIQHLEGRGTRKDTKRARVLFQQAAKMGEPIAMHRLAVRILKGEQAGKNRGVAIDWLKKAKAAGHKHAESTLARLGVGTPSSDANGKISSKRAAALRKKRPKYILYAYMKLANKRRGLKRYRASNINARIAFMIGKPESEIFHGMLLQNNDFLNKNYIGPGTRYQFKNRQEMRDAMLKPYLPHDPYNPIRFRYTEIAHDIMDALSTHMGLDLAVTSITVQESKR